jgi:RNA polymerase sporulation-specific sigma factor
LVGENNKRDEFIEKNLGLVHSLCHRFTGKGIDYDDLYQTGCIGLIKAVDAFDEERGICFSTYAFPVILGELKRLFRDGGAVKVSRSLKELSLKVTKFKDKFEASVGREPTVGEIAEEFSVSRDEIAEAVCVAQPVLSLTYESEGGYREYDLPCYDIEDNLSNKLFVDGVLEKLKPIERDIIYHRYYNGLTQSRTASILNMSQVQVSRTEKEALSQIRRMIMTIEC